VDYLHHGKKQNNSSLQSFDVADSVGYINLLFNECDDGDDGISDVVNANQVDGIADDVNPNEVDGIASGVNTDEVEFITDIINANGLDGLTDSMNPDEVGCFADGVIDDMGTATSMIGNNEATTTGLLVATKCKRKLTDLSLRFLEK
jgi:hypothetical protein